MRAHVPCCFAVLPVVLIAALAGCSKSSTRGSEDGGGGDARPDALLRSDGGPEPDASPEEDRCPEDPVVGDPCDEEGLSCGECPPDPCSFCNITQCADGEWQRLEAHPAPCFECGDVRCVQDEQYCSVVRSDFDMDDSYTCKDTPDECRPATCSCLEEEEAFMEPSSCSEDDGNVTVTHPGG